MEPSPSIIVFDGVCRLCTASLRFVDRHDSMRRFKYVAFQSDGGRLVCDRLSIKADALESFVLIEEGRIFTKGAAWTQTLKRLRFPWSILGSLLSVLPSSLVDGGYQLIGRWRFRLFGRLDSCTWPPEADGRIASNNELKSALASVSAQSGRTESC